MTHTGRTFISRFVRTTYATCVSEMWVCPALSDLTTVSVTTETRGDACRGCHAHHENECDRIGTLALYVCARAMLRKRARVRTYHLQCERRATLRASLSQHRSSLRTDRLSNTSVYPHICQDRNCSPFDPTTPVCPDFLCCSMSRSIARAERNCGPHTTINHDEWCEP